MEGGQPEPRLQRGEAVGRYVVLHLVGAGAMGEVYKAHDTALDRPVALKVLTVAPGDRQLEESIAVREGQMLALVRHPGVVAVYDVGVHSPSTFIALEYVEGKSLRDAITEGELDATKVRSVALQLAEGLVAVHEAGLIHRDIKPGNILIDESGDARLADLGVAKLVIDMTLDQEGTGGTWVGTPGYRAPEVEAGERASQAADVYSLCASLCEAAPETPPASWRRLLRVLRRGLDDDPRQRPTAADLVASLRPKPTTWIGVAAAASIAAAVAIATQAREPEPSIDHLAAAELRLAPVWNPSVELQLRSWASAPSPDAAGGGWAKREIVRVLEGRAGAWKEAAAEVAVLGAAEETVLHERCLDAAMASLGGAVEVTLGREGPPDPLLAWIHGLPVASACLRGDLHRQRFASWTDDDSAQHLKDLERLQRADGAIALGEGTEATSIIDELSSRGDLGVLQGHLAYLKGLLAFRTRGSAAEVVPLYRAAIVAAETYGDRLLVARATVELSRMLVLTADFDEARFAVERAFATLGPQPGAELLTVRLLDAYANLEGRLGTDETRASVRQRLEAIEPRIDPTGYEALYLHFAWAQLLPDSAEEHELAAWQLASVYVGPAHELTRNWRERYTRDACRRWTVETCTRRYEELRAELSDPVLAVTMQAYALSLAGQGWAAWELRTEIADAMESSGKSAQSLIGGLTLASLAMTDAMGDEAERRAMAESAVGISTSLGATEYIAGARMLAATTFGALGDRERAEFHLGELDGLKLDDDLVGRFARARTKLALGDSAAALKELEELEPLLDEAKNNLWVQRPDVGKALCLASFRAGSLEQVARHCTHAAEESAALAGEREEAMVRLVLRQLSRSRLD